MKKLAAITRSFSKAMFAYEGKIDAFSDGVVHGWVKKKKEDGSICVECRVNGHALVTNYLAEIWRSDVEDAGIGTGRYGFEIHIPKKLFADVERLDIEIVQAGTNFRILSRKFQSVKPSHIPIPSADDDDTKAAPDETFGHNLLAQNTVKSSPGANFLSRFESVSAIDIKGYSLNKAQPSDIFEIALRLDNAFLCACKNDIPRNDLVNAGIGCGLGGFEISVPITFLEPGAHRLEAILPDGSVHMQEFIIPSEKLRVQTRSDPSVDTITIIVPVFNAAQDLEKCIERLKAFKPAATHLLFIDDASTDPNVARILAGAYQIEGARVLTNNENLGYTRTVNRGIEEAGTHDVILLNSDARVTPGWVQGMTEAANSASRIGTVTAMSDRAGAFSAPRLGNENYLPPLVGEIDFARAFRARSLGLYPTVPTGNGFCMLIRRACIDEMGPFDAEAFPRGYGEENDFCMRAGRAGWRHVIDDTTYVFHSRSKSFGDSKTELMQAGRAVIDERYPEYKSAIQVYKTSPFIVLARHRAWRALADCAGPASALPGSRS